MKDILKKLELLVGRDVPAPPKPEDFKNKGDYVFAKTLHKKFPKELNPPSARECLEVKELADLWGWANGEKGIGKIKPGYKLLSVEESGEIKESLYNNASVDWLHDLHPIFLAPYDFYICLKSSSGEIIAVNLTAGKILVLSDTLDRYFKYLIACISKGVYGDTNYNNLDPESYIRQEIDAAKEVGLDNYYPLTKNEKTLLDYLLFDGC